MKHITLSLALLTSILFANDGKIDMHGTETSEKVELFYGKVLEIKTVTKYTYLKVDENGKEVWVAIATIPIKVGDRIGYDKKTVMHHFESKTLGKTFEEIIFASHVYLPQKPKSMKDMLGLSPVKDVH